MAESLDELTSMAVFARVVEARSFSEAARRLGLSKSAVSKRIARLEDDLGAPLLVRTTRRIALTEAGSAFYEHCARIVSAAQEARSQITDAGSEPRGSLRVNVPVTLGEMYLAPVLPRFAARYPDVHVEVTTDDGFVNVVDEGYDVVVRVAALEDSSLIARKLASDRRVVCGSPDYLRLMGTPTHPHDLLQHNCLRYAHMTVRDEWQFQGPEGRLSVSARGTFKANNGLLLKEAALQGLGLIVGPRFMVSEELARGRLVTVLDDYAGPEHGVYAMYAQRRHVSPKVRVFVDFLVAAFRELGDWARPEPAAPPLDPPEEPAAG
ncbi:MAG: LysR family transcriptional regulator [Myxococcota bacterium]